MQLSNRLRENGVNRSVSEESHLHRLQLSHAAPHAFQVLCRRRRMSVRASEQTGSAHQVWLVSYQRLVLRLWSSSLSKKAEVSGSGSAATDRGTDTPTGSCLVKHNLWRVGAVGNSQCNHCLHQSEVLMTLWIRLYYYTYIHTSTNRLCYSTALSSSAHCATVRMHLIVSRWYRTDTWQPLRWCSRPAACFLRGYGP